MSSNRGVVYLGPGKVEVQSIDYPKMQNPEGKQIEHGVILKIVSTNICGSDLHMYEGRTDMESGRILGHENLGKHQRPGELLVQRLHLSQAETRRVERDDS